MGIEYKNVTARVHTGWRDVFTVPAGKQAILSSANMTNLYPSDAGSSLANTTFGLRMVDTSNNITNITSNIIINRGSATQMLAGKLVLTANQKLQVAQAPFTGAYTNGYQTSGNIFFNSWSSIGLANFQITSMDSNGSEKVAVGYSGYIARSTDGGKTWSKMTSPATGTLFKVKYLNSIWIAVGASGNVLTSSDGITWTKQTFPSSGTLSDVFYYASAFYTIDQSATTINRSTNNGVTWTSVYASATNISYGNIVYNGTTFIAYRENNSTANSQIYTSTNGTTWTQPTTSTFLTGGSECFGYMFAIGSTFYGFVINTASSYQYTKLMTSTNATTWTTVSTAPFNELAMNGSNYPYIYDKTRYYTANNVGFLFFVAGTASDPTFGSYNKVLYTTDNGANWSIAGGVYNSPPDGFTYDSTYGYQSLKINTIYNLGFGNLFADANNSIGDLAVSYVEVTP